MSVKAPIDSRILCLWSDIILDLHRTEKYMYIAFPIDSTSCCHIQDASLTNPITKAEHAIPVLNLSK